jgi:hypothetical protein
MKSFGYFFIWIFSLSYYLYAVSSWSIQANLTCSRSLNICRLTHRGLTGLRTEEFTVQNLESAEVSSDGESLPMVILKTSQGDKNLTTDSQSDGASLQVNAFISNPKQELLQVEQSNSWAPFDLIPWISLLIMSIGVLINSNANRSRTKTDNKTKD